MASTTSSHHIVIPGQIIATSSANDEENSFLRGHGTYLENVSTGNHNGGNHDNPDQNIVTGDDQEHQEHQEHQGHQEHQEDEEDEEERHLRLRLLNQQHHLIASSAGTITRTNKLIQITPPNAPYSPQTGDPIIGRITSISTQRWNVSLNLTTNAISLSASLPLTGIHMPDGMQRIRTNADALTMRNVLCEGDLISAEVRAVQSKSNTSSSSAAAATTSSAGTTAATPGVSITGASAIGNVILHARSVRCGKLQNGCFVMVPSWLIGRRKKQFVVLGLPDNHNNNNNNNSSSSSNSSNSKYSTKPGFDGIQIEVLLGCNGGIWIQRAMMELESSSSSTSNSEIMMVQEQVQRIRKNHAIKEMTMEERIVLARVKNAVEALKLVYCKITPENIEAVVASSVQLGYEVVDMLRHDVIANITACTRNNNIRRL